MKLLPLVSIVIPAFNAGKYLRFAIDSILSQSYKNIELIVIDDGSTDNTREILESYGDLFFWDFQKNAGQAKSLNRGWQMAKGNILGYLSADDLLLPEAISKAVDTLNRNEKAVLAYSDFTLIDSNSKLIRKISAPEYSYYKMVTGLVCAPGPGAFFTKDAYLKAGDWNPNLRRFPDYEYWLRLGLYGDFIHIHENLASFRVHSQSISFANTSIYDAEEGVRIIDYYYRNTLKVPSRVYAAKSLACSNAILLAAQLHLRSGRFFLGMKRIFNAFYLYPFNIFKIGTLRVIINGFFYRPLHNFLSLFRDAIK